MSRHIVLDVGVHAFLCRYPEQFRVFQNAVITGKIRVQWISTEQDAALSHHAASGHTLGERSVFSEIRSEVLADYVLLCAGADVFVTNDKKLAEGIVHANRHLTVWDTNKLLAHAEFLSLTALPGLTSAP